jgi:hypothetical protein
VTNQETLVADDDVLWLVFLLAPLLDEEPA